MGALASSIAGAAMGNTGGTTNSSGSSGSNLWTPEMEDLYGQLVGDVMAGGAPTGPEHVGLNQGQLDAIAGMGSGGTAGQYYQGLLSGEGQADRYNALQDLNAASAAQASSALEGSLSSIGLGASEMGNSNSSRRGVMEGVATAQANTDLSALQAQQNNAFLQNEQSIMGNAANALQGIYGQQLAASGVLQQDEIQKALAEWKKTHAGSTAGMFEYLTGIANNASGLAGSWQQGSTTDEGSGLLGKLF
ncbi:hypothetical protein [Enterovibrio baiacu]|uniref:hypothetical protein n=1 Tax=Enterovibrio baiacu TaxID=2491023 RepID=UPI001011BA14|nr:hypothetical protein [Enterovibrio baiacu]MBE1275098.1 hypothetical protein [Enterovibrio baiacu]